MYILFLSFVFYHFGAFIHLAAGLLLFRFNFMGTKVDGKVPGAQRCIATVAVCCQWSADSVNLKG